MKGYAFRLDGVEVDVSPVYRPGAIDLEIDGRRVAARLESLGDGAFRIHVDGRAHRVWIARRDGLAFVHLEGRVFEVAFSNTLEALLAEAERAGGDALVAPMPGTVVRVAAEPGQAVAEGDLLVVIESMKLQTSIAAPHDAHVAEIAFREGESFDKGAVLVRLETEGGGSPAKPAEEDPS